MQLCNESRRAGLVIINRNCVCLQCTDARLSGPVYLAGSLTTHALDVTAARWNEALCWEKKGNSINTSWVISCFDVGEKSYIGERGDWDWLLYVLCTTSLGFFSPSLFFLSYLNPCLRGYEQRWLDPNVQTAVAAAAALNHNGNRCCSFSGVNRLKTRYTHTKKKTIPASVETSLNYINSW